jgi:hypothetical protein
MFMYFQNKNINQFELLIQVSSFLPHGAAAQGELWPAQQSASILRRDG